MPKTRETKIENGVQLWPCNRCGKWFTIDGFYKDKRAKRWGITANCKKCHSKIVIETRNKDLARKRARSWQKKTDYRHRPESIQRDHERSMWRNKTVEAKCRFITNRAIKKGILERPLYCSICGKATLKGRDHAETIVEAHHDDYFRPLEVKWMCKLCHAEYHRR